MINKLTIFLGCSFAVLSSCHRDNLMHIVLIFLNATGVLEFTGFQQEIKSQPLDDVHLGVHGVWKTSYPGSQNVR